MLGELHDLALGPLGPTVAAIFAMLGSLLAIIVAARARARTGGRRIRLVAYATVSVALFGSWLPNLVSVLGLRVDDSVVRLDPARLGLSAGIPLVATLGGLLLLCYGRIGPERLFAGVLLLASGVAGGADLMLRSVVTGGQISANRPYLAAELAVAAVSGGALALLLGAAKSLRRSVLAAVPVGVALAAVSTVGTAGLSVRPGPQGVVPADEITGLVPMTLGLPAVVLGGVLLALMWYFAIGTDTGRDLRLAFEPGTDADQIEPWMIEQVRSRVALSSTALAPAGWGQDVWAERTVAVRSIPLLGGAVASAFARGVRDTPHAELPGPVPAPAPGQEEEPEPPTIGSPGWRPVPGWGLPAGDRSVVSPTTGAWLPTRAGARWDERDWDQLPADRNENRSPSPERATNSRQGQLPRRGRQPEPAQAPLIPAGGVPATPLPRRNAR
jgi:hypothetical protein